MDRCRLGWLLDYSRKDDRFGSRRLPGNCPKRHFLLASRTSLNGIFCSSMEAPWRHFSDLRLGKRLQFSSFGTHVEGPHSCVLKLPVALPKSAVTWPELAVTGQKITGHTSRITGHTSQTNGPPLPKLPYTSRWRWPSQPNTDEQEKLASTGPGRSYLVACGIVQT